MFCIVSFIILCLICGFVLLVSIWIPRIRKNYFKWLKKAWECVIRKFTLQKCETTFKDEVKNSILRKTVLKKPKLVKPIGICIEVLVVISTIIIMLLMYLVIKGLIN